MFCGVHVLKKYWLVTEHAAFILAFVPHATLSAFFSASTTTAFLAFLTFSSFVAVLEHSALPMILGRNSLQLFPLVIFRAQALKFSISRVCRVELGAHTPQD
jgi:hypothetical protein